MNPVIFPELPESEELVIYSKSLDEFGWVNRIVGLTQSGFLYVDERIAQEGYDLYDPKVLDWVQVDEVRIGK